jgi:hypothetical protein
MSVYDDALDALEREMKENSRKGMYIFWVDASEHYVSKLLVDALADALMDRTGLDFEVIKDRESDNKGSLVIFLDCECFDPESSTYVEFFNMSDIDGKEPAEPLSNRDRSRLIKIANELWKVKCGF